MFAMCMPVVLYEVPKSLLDVPSDTLEHHILKHLSAASLFSCSLVCSRLRRIASRVLQEFVAKYNETEKKKPKIRQQIPSSQEMFFQHAFRDGSVSVLRWLQAQFMYPSWKAKQQRSSKNEQNRKQELLSKGLGIAAREGHFQMLQQLHQEDSAIDRKRNLCDGAAEGGHLQVLKWARANGCEWYAGTCAYAAAKGGHLEVLKWIFANGCTWDAMNCAFGAAHGGRLEVLKWLHENWCTWNVATCAAAAAGGHLEVLKWLREKGCPWNAMTCAYAAEIGHLELLKWAHEHSCPWNVTTCTFAAKEGHLEVLKWLHNNSCPWNEDTCAAAAAHGHLEVLKWLREKGCPWNAMTCAYAAKEGHLEVLKWAHKSGCPWDPEERSTVTFSWIDKS